MISQGNGLVQSDDKPLFEPIYHWKCPPQNKKKIANKCLQILHCKEINLVYPDPIPNKFIKELPFTDGVIFLNDSYATVSDMFWNQKTVKDVDIITNIN